MNGLFLLFIIFKIFITKINIYIDNFKYPHQDNRYPYPHQDNRYPENIPAQIKKGTTTCALSCKDGVVLAADTRASAGLFIADRNVMKIQKVDNHLGMTIAGGVADAQNLVDTMRYQANIYRISNKILMPVSAAARLCSNILFNQRYFPYYVQIIMSGYEEKEEGKTSRAARSPWRWM